MEIKLFTRSIRAAVEKDIYLFPVRLRNGNPITVGTVISSETTSDGRQQLTIDINERNKARFEDLGEEEWVENHFKIYRNRLMLEAKKK
ncbi:MAG: hypothetical protein ACRDBQ_18140 [Shewanella sp.]